MAFEKEGRSLRRALGVAGAALAAVAVAATPSTSVSQNWVPSASNASQKVDAETTFVNGIDRTKLKEYLHAYASKPHPAGSYQDYVTALYTKQQFEKFGLKAEIQEYYPLLSEPKRMPRVAITAPAINARELNLTEGAVAGDKCSTEKDALPPYFAYSPSGNVSAPIVYVNYGRLDDFKWLVDNGVQLKGKIALARSGKNFRGLKAMSAEEHGMIGTLIYTDPQDDGYTVGPVYPAGPWRPADSFQRGSMEYVSMYSGDPLTPGFASVKGAPYLKIDEATNIPKAPTTTLSYGQAIHILKSLGGKKAPTAWQGTLSLPNGYYIGDDGATEVTIDIDMDNRVRPIWNVIGTIKGAEEPEQSVILGNHRDGWVCGAVDPSSGSSTMLEIARNYGQLLKKGWRPRRTIKIASWDGEEVGLLGSTEFAEDHREELLKGAVAYINVDLTFGPTISAGATPAVTDIMFETAKAVPANKFYGTETETTMYEQWFNQAEATRKANPAMDSLTLAPEHMVLFLGSGSDYTPFYQHLGIVSVNFMYAYPQGAYGTYHSTTDSIAYLENLADPNYSAQQTTAQWWGLLAMRLATSPILPLNFTTYGITMSRDLNNWETKTKALGLAIDYSGLRSSIDQFTSKAYEFSNSTVAFKAAYNSGKASNADVKKLNNKLIQLERQFISDKGLPHRPWYRHVIFGPGFFEGYAGTSFPGISDAVAFNDNATTIQTHVDEVAVIVKNAGDFLLSN